MQDISSRMLALAYHFFLAKLRLDILNRHIDRPPKLAGQVVRIKTVDRGGQGEQRLGRVGPEGRGRVSKRRH